MFLDSAFIEQDSCAAHCMVFKTDYKKAQATDVVSFHFALTPACVTALRRLGNTIPLTVIVTDPFTVPNAWFYEKTYNTSYFRMRQKQAVEQCGVPEKTFA